jgi:hypothetical protein
LFNFPTNKTRRELWIVKVKRDKWKPTKSSALCEVSKISRSVLNYIRIAYPTVKLRIAGIVKYSEYMQV